MELSGLVAEAAERDFGQFNHEICHNPRAKVYVEDARIYLEAARGRFDVIVGDLFTPWRPGEASLSSLEQFRAAREALRSGGIFCQWIELEQWTPEEFQMAAATFRKAFGHLYLFRAGFQAWKLPVGLLGFRDGAPDWGTVARRCEFETHHGHLVDPLCRHPEGVAMLYLGEYIPPADAESRISTLGNLRIELDASRQLAGGDPNNYYSGSGANWSSLLQDQLTAIESRKQLPEGLRACPRVGWLAARFELAEEANDPAARSLAQRLLNQIPTAIAADSSADWSLWPGSSSPWEFLNVGHPSVDSSR